MATTIVIYGFEGTYSGQDEYEYRNPEVGHRHKCMLFLSQDGDQGQYERALTECNKYGFTDVLFERHGAFQVDVLNTDLYRGFACFYEEALEDGRSLVYYPNDA